MGGKPTSGLAIAGLITGIIPFTCLLGVILSFIAVFLTGPNSPKKGRGLAISGTIVGLLWCVGWVVLLFIGLKSMGWGTTYGPKILLYSMEIRIEQFKEIEGRYPESMDEYWSKDMAKISLDDDGGIFKQMDLSGFEEFIDYAVTNETNRPYRLFCRNLNPFDAAKGGKQWEHQYGINPIPEIRQYLEQQWFVDHEEVELICERIQWHFDSLKGRPFDSRPPQTAPSAATPGAQ